jgi:hypothetical protein
MDNWIDFNSKTIEQDDFILTNGDWFCVECIDTDNEILNCMDMFGGEVDVCFGDVECVDNIINRYEKEID